MTTTKRELIIRIAEQTGHKRETVRGIVECFLRDVMSDLTAGKRIEFRHFGVFEVRDQDPRVAINPKTLEQVPLPRRKSVRFKSARLMKQALRQGKLPEVAPETDFDLDETNDESSDQ